MTYADIYNFRGVVEPAVANVLKAAKITAYTTQTPVSFQRTRPRVDLVYLHGAGQKRWWVPKDSTGLVEIAGNPISIQLYAKRRESAWSGQLKMEVITGANIEEHDDYVAHAFYVMSGLVEATNGLVLRNHQLFFVGDGGISHRQATTEGYFATVMLFNLMITVQDNVWATLVTP